jgi:predicted RNA-binding protein associated with RNAse of E/G family
MNIRLIKPLKRRIITYEAEVVARTPTSVTVRAPWGHGPLDLGLLSFAPGDVLTEHYYSDRWYNVFAIRDAAGHLKGWYCNVTRPAQIGPDLVESEDLELDLLVSADRCATRLDDEDEFAVRDLARAEPAAHAAALAAVEELRALVAAGSPPFHELVAEGA